MYTLFHGGKQQQFWVKYFSLQFSSVTIFTIKLKFQYVIFITIVIINSNLLMRTE